MAGSAASTASTRLALRQGPAATTHNTGGTTIHTTRTAYSSSTLSVNGSHPPPPPPRWATTIRKGPRLHSGSCALRWILPKFVEIRLTLFATQHTQPKAWQAVCLPSQCFKLQPVGHINVPRQLAAAADHTCNNWVSQFMLLFVPRGHLRP